ncbi:MAG: alpha/beta hydrolase [Verrucomicrobia bacterium]|nr:alpha/beta hydrolase [Verrucomicrobiota bacterium]
MNLRSTALLVISLGGTFAASAAEPQVVPLWPDGAPGSAARRTEPEKVTGTNVSNIHHPSLLVYLPPPAESTGCAVVVAPGGGHARLAIHHEGYNVGTWLARHGIAAFILKYRLAKDDATPAGAPQPYTVDRDSLADAHRALRLVRARASEWRVNPAAVGIIGFSAGGEVALVAALHAPLPPQGRPDAIDSQKARPDFYGLIYPGGLSRTDLALTKEAPPVFLTAGYADRPNISEGLAEFYLKTKRAGATAEPHIFAGAGHGFGVRETNRGPQAEWLARFHEWLAERKFLAAARAR